MKKITAVLVILSLLVGNFSAVAQVPGKFLSPRNFKGGIKGLKYVPLATSSPALRTAELLARVERASRAATLEKTFSLNKLRQHIQAENITLVPRAILSHPIEHERATLLRRIFPVLGNNASLEERSQAAAFWREDLSRQTVQITQNAAAANDALADAASLGLFGQKEDIALLEDFYQTVKTLPQAPKAAAVLARTLLAHGEYEKLEEFFAVENGLYAGLQNGIAQYVKEKQINANVAFAPLPENYKEQPFQAQISTDGLSAALAADPSEQATSIWVNLTLSRPSAAAVPSTPVKSLQNPLELPPLSLQDPQALQLSAQEIIPPAVEKAGGQISGNNVPAGNIIIPMTAETVVPVPETAVPVSTPSQRKKLIDFFKKKAPQTQAAQPHTTAAAVSAPRISAKTVWGKIKNLFSKKPAPAQNAVPAGNDLNPKEAALQRAGIYMASYVMGLEVATPVIANFGSSFGLSLEENILVAVATYFPYSVGAILSNWTKKWLGRRNSMNLGLALMGGGLMAGVLFCGLNGAFVPQADTLMHFYKALACITIASMGGVIVHNSVGPIMTELSKNASELVKQKRNSYTELSRALGMASSFAFPYLATKVMGMDWSLAFALPIPLIGAAALGVNLAKIPNTKTVLKKAAKTGIQPKKTFKELIKNNEYVRLFKEEKGVGAFLGGLTIMNAVEMSYNNGFLFMLPSMTTDQSSQYLFGLAQFAAPFILGRYLAGKFLQWFPQHNMSVATLMAAGGGLASLFALGDPYALTAALFLAETGISTGFTLGFARTAKNPATQDRVVALLVASAISCAFGPLLLTNLAQSLIDAGIMDTSTATATAMLGIPSALALFSAALFKRMENMGAVSSSVLKRIYSFVKKSVFFPKQRRKRS
ncbi:MAG: hypothetical protein ACI351_02665 [Candidatus Avelusimicrobium sp.]|uniref:hypothetical protein n=1 Tax=Candidatus Avelusimicrobium sp. TaxID=3048833 RepID=UPI003F0FB864